MKKKLKGLDLQGVQEGSGEAVSAEGGRRPTGAETGHGDFSEEAPGASAQSSGGLLPGQRWTAGRKQAAVMRLFQGESLLALSRELGLVPAVLDRWRTEALEGMQEALLHRNRTPEQAIEINRLYRRIGELTMQTEILEAAMKLRGVTDFPKGKSRL